MMQSNSKTILPITQDGEELDRAVLEQLDLHAKKVERLTGFSVQRGDPASADFLMSLLAGQLVWNDITLRANLEHSRRMEHLSGTLAKIDEAVTQMRSMRDEVLSARNDIRGVSREVATLFREQLDKIEDAKGKMTYMGLLAAHLEVMDQRTKQMEGHVVAMMDGAAAQAAGKAEKMSQEAVGKAVLVQLQVHGNEAVQGLKQVVKDAKDAADRMNRSADKAAQRVEQAMAPKKRQHGSLRTAWLWLEHTVGVAPMLGIGAVVVAGVYLFR